MNVSPEIMEALLRVEAGNDRTSHVHRPPPPLGVVKKFDSTVSTMVDSSVDSTSTSTVDSRFDSTSTTQLNIIIEVKHG